MRSKTVVHEKNQLQHMNVKCLSQMMVRTEGCRRGVEAEYCDENEAATARITSARRGTKMVDENHSLEQSEEHVAIIKMKKSSNREEG